MDSSDNANINMFSSSVNSARKLPITPTNTADNPFATSIEASKLNPVKGTNADIQNEYAKKGTY